MQFLKIEKNTKLLDLSKYVGYRNVDAVLHMNETPRVPNVGSTFYKICDDKIANSTFGDDPDAALARKESILNTFTQDSDIFELAASQGSRGWKLLDAMGTFYSYMKIPESVTIPDSSLVLGNKQAVPEVIYSRVMTNIRDKQRVDLAVFNNYSAAKQTNIEDTTFANYGDGGPMQWFNLPWGKITLYSSLSGETVEFPVYPEEIGDGVKANYTTMPDLIYQYEPWQLYQSSGPRTQDFTFDFHRDMWTGDHRDGKSNDLIRACEANCYPEYKGSSVYTSLVTLYIAGEPLITGVLTEVSTQWDGPLSQFDGWYLHCVLKLSITEVAPQPLNYTSVRRKPLIG